MKTNMWKIFLSFLVIYSYFSVWIGFNENSRFALVRSIVDDNKLEIDNYADETGDRAFFNNHLYTEKSPGGSLIAIPSYFVWKIIYNYFFPNDFKQKYASQESVVIENVSKVHLKIKMNPGLFILISMIVVLVFTSSLFGALLNVLIYKFSSFFLKSEKDRMIITLTSGLGTNIFTYSTYFLGIIVSTFLAFFSFFLIYIALYYKNKIKYVPISGMLLGLSIITEYIAGIFLPLFVFWLLSRKKEYLIPFILGVFLGLLPLFSYNYSIFGDPTKITRNYLDPSLYPEYLVGNSGFIFPPRIFVMFKLLFDPYRGLFYYSPILFFGILGIIYAFKQYKQYKLELLIIGIALSFLTIILSQRYDWWGGAVFGNRFLLIVTPFVIFPLVLFFKSFKRYKFFNIIFFCVLLISIFNSFLGLQNVETLVMDKERVDMDNSFRRIENSLQPFPNVLISHYLPQFLKYGPRSRIFESISNGYIDIDIRGIPLSKSKSFPFDSFFIPFLAIIPILIIILLIWFRSIYEILIRIFKH
jgi:hypothetical protein